MMQTAAVQVSPQEQLKANQDMWHTQMQMAQTAAHYAHIEALARDGVEIGQVVLPLLMIVIAGYLLIRKGIAAGIVKNDSDNQAEIQMARCHVGKAEEPSAD